MLRADCDKAHYEYAQDSDNPELKANCDALTETVKMWKDNRRTHALEYLMARAFYYVHHSKEKEKTYADVYGILLNQLQTEPLFLKDDYEIYYPQAFDYVEIIRDRQDPTKANPNPHPYQLTQQHYPMFMRALENNRERFSPNPPPADI